MTFRQVIPNSSINRGNVDYEYYLVWLSKGGGVRNWLFSHTDGQESTKNKSVEIETLTDIRSIPTEERKEVRVRTMSLSSEEYEYVKSIRSSNRIYQVTKDAQKVPVSIKPDSVSKPNQNKEFRLQFTLVFQEEDALIL